MGHDLALPAVSLFAGCGGLDLGVGRAGFDVRIAVEMESDAAATLRANLHPDRGEAVLERSVIGLRADELLERAGLRRGEAALAFGGPPCTPFSKAGYWLEYKRNGLDPNAALVDEFARLVIGVLPSAVLMENVPGLARKGQTEGPFVRLQSALREAGYTVMYSVLNAADYGVPQARRRLFLYGWLGGAPPDFPTPTHGGPSERSDSTSPLLSPHIGSGLAIRDLEKRQEFAEPEEIVSGRYAELLPEVPAGSNYLHFTAERGHADPQFKWRSRYWTFLLKLDPDRPSSTIQSHPGPYTGPFHWSGRRLRLPEVKRLQAFPDDFLIVGSRRSAQRQLGNAVPPTLAEIVARPLAERLSISDVTLATEPGAAA